jgi:hypothetical protein
MLAFPQYRVWLVAAGLVAPNLSAEAQVRWTVDPKSSLAWWQMNPHMNHLWATTCPGEPSWRPGEDRTAAAFMRDMLRAPSTLDTLNVPIYPRYAVRDVCAEAVRGEVTATDTLNWRGVRGQIVVTAKGIVTGNAQRDRYTHEAVLEVPQHPEVRFTIDSLFGIARQADTLRGSVMGVLALHGVERPILASLSIWPEDGGLRVISRFSVTARSLVDVYGFSSHALGLGVGVRIWQQLFMGVDLLVRPQTTADS